MFISGIAIHATPQYPDFYQNPGKDSIMVRFGRFQNRYQSMISSWAPPSDWKKVSTNYNLIKAHIAYAYHGQFDNRKPSGQGFIGALLAWAHCLTSYFFSRPRKRNEMVWVSF